MSQSSFGNKFKVTTWGESHGKALGAVVDGCPAGLSLSEDDIQVWIDYLDDDYDKNNDGVLVLSY